METVADKIWVVAGVLTLVLIIVLLARQRKAVAKEQGAKPVTTGRAFAIGIVSAMVLGMVYTIIMHFKEDRFDGPTTHQSVSPTIFPEYGKRRFARSQGREVTIQFLEGLRINGTLLTKENADLRVRGYRFHGASLRMEIDDAPLSGVNLDVFDQFELRAGENSLIRDRLKCVPSGVVTISYGPPVKGSVLAKKD